MQVTAFYVIVAMLATSGWQVAAINRHNQALAEQRAAAAILATAKPVDKKPTLIFGGLPTTISLPKYDLNLKILKGNYNSTINTWSVAPRDAQFAEGSSWPNNWRGNTIIYGHNNVHVFGLTKTLKAGDKAIITTATGHRFVYAFVKSTQVKPEQTAILSKSTSSPELTILTCTGLFNEYRRLMHFTLVEAV